MDASDSAPEAPPTAAQPYLWNACGVHPDVPATFTCSRCGTFGCDPCLHAMTPMPICVTCAARGENAVPWERRETLGLWRAFWDTSREVCFSPQEFFARPSSETLTGGPVYGVVVYTVSTLLLTLQLALFYALGAAALGMSLGGDEALGAGLGVGVGVFGCLMVPISLVQAPVMALMGLAFALAGAHLSLMLMKQARGSWEDTLRGVGYANAGYLWMAVPCVGLLIAQFVVVWLEARAMSATHRTSFLAALAATSLWRLLFVSGGIALYVVFFALVIGAATGAAAGGVP